MMFKVVEGQQVKVKFLPAPRCRQLKLWDPVGAFAGSVRYKGLSDEACRAFGHQWQIAFAGRLEEEYVCVRCNVVKTKYFQR